MTDSISSPLETRITGSIPVRFWLELFGNSVHFPIANILLELLIEKPLDYLLAPDLYAIVTASLAQAYWLTRWQTSPHPRRFWGNLIGPALYTLVESLLEGPRFFSAPHHLAYWGFALAIGALQALRLGLPAIFSASVIVIENVTRASILFFMYVIFEAYTNPAQTSSLSVFFGDTSHQFIGLAVLFLGLGLGLANLTADHYQRLLAEETQRRNERRLRELIDIAPFSAHLYELRADGRLVFAGANDSANTILGIDNRQFVGKTIEEAFPALAKTEIPLMYRRVASQGIKYNTEQVIQKDNGVEGVYDVHAIQISPGRMVAFFPK